MKKIAMILFLLCSTTIYSQFDLAAGMGIGFVNNSSLKDYIDGLQLNEQLGVFSSSFELYAEGDYNLSEKYQLGIEYVYTIFSITSPFGGIGQYDLTYNHHKPSILAYYVISGEGYKFKFGGGAGLRIVDLDEKILDEVNYTASGLGVLGRIQAHTRLSDDFYVNIGTTLRYDFPGEPESSDGSKIRDVAINDVVNINSLSISLNIGLSYFIN